MKQTALSFGGILSIMFLVSACKEESYSYNGHDYVDLGLSVKWATCNVGAQNPEDFGEYYAWGETRSKLTYTWRGYRFRASGNSFSDIKFSKYNHEEFSVTQKKMTPMNAVLEPADDVANQEWGGDWRMPTKQEIEELVWNCDWTWTTRNGVNGVKILSKVEGYTDRSIFIPAAGLRDDQKLLYAGQYGNVWSSTNSEYKGQAFALHFDSRGSHIDRIIHDFIEEDWQWYGTEEESDFSRLPQSLADKLRKYFDTGKVNVDSIPQSIYEEYRAYLKTVDWNTMDRDLRYKGLPVRPVCP